MERILWLARPNRSMAYRTGTSSAADTTHTNQDRLVAWGAVAQSEVAWLCGVARCRGLKPEKETDCGGDDDDDGDGVPKNVSQSHLPGNA